MAEKEVKKRLKSRVGWRHGMKEMVKEEYNREMPVARVDPMTPLHMVVTGVELEKSKDSYTEEQLRQLTEAKIIEVDADIEIFTDRSHRRPEEGRRGHLRPGQEWKHLIGRMQSSRETLLII